MSHVSGGVRERKKSGATRTVRASRVKVPPKKAAAFMKDFNKLLKKHGIPRA
jgi:hypothetical protein